MSRCVFCGNKPAVFPLYKNDKNDAYLCDRCQETLALLFHAAKKEPYEVYAKYRENFRKEYGDSAYTEETLAKADSVWDESHSIPDGELPPAQTGYEPEQTEEEPARRDAYPAGLNMQAAPAAIPPDSSYYPNKLLLSTVLALLSLALPVLGLLPALIADKMADEIPYPYCATDVNRAKNISFAAIIFCAAEILAGVITAIILLSQI
jgi:hypothetical protein